MTPLTPWLLQFAVRILYCINLNRFLLFLTGRAGGRERAKGILSGMLKEEYKLLVRDEDATEEEEDDEAKKRKKLEDEEAEDADENPEDEEDLDEEDEDEDEDKEDDDLPDDEDDEEPGI